MQLPVRQEFGLTRTTCDCPDCTINCHFIPGYLVPGDLSRMWMAAGPRVSFFQWAKENLLASPGATVFSADRGKFNIPTLVPGRRPDGACKFLDDDNRCTVHAASPFGCAYFDSHQSVEMGLRGSALGLNAVIQNSQPNGLYRRTWEMLHEAGLCAPSPTECRERMSKALTREVKA